MKNSLLICLVAVSLLSCKIEHKPLVNIVKLNKGWEFRDQEKQEWLPATIPGTVHTDLYNNHIIPDPFYGCNEKDLQWIGQTDWVYRTSFDLDEKTLSAENISLVFEGVDTYAKVFLNGSEILQANNMFRTWEADCKKLLQAGNNILKVYFESAENRFLEDSLALGYPLPGGRWNFSRKAAYHFGWDWGPKFVTCGIWKPVYLKVWNNHIPLYINILTQEIHKKEAQLEAFVQLHSSKDERAVLRIRDMNSKRILHRTELQLVAGNHQYNSRFSIKNPKLWWSNGLGDPHLYDLEVELTTQSGFIYKKKISHGIRTIEVITEEDQFGRSFFLKLNGEPVYIKGANYIPQHSFVTKVSDENYWQIIQTAVESNMNMLRVWGGGIYEKDIFYELCDRNGILVWQDFMFACAMYPGNEDFLENVRKEAIEQVQRLKKHASLALWCGNNESDEGWHNWGWQKQYGISQEDSAKIWEGYQKIFHQILPEVVGQYSPGHFYLSTSPLHGWGRKESMEEGSAHYWGVWWGMQPFEKYLEKVPRFMSEFGFQAMSAISAIRNFQPPEEDSLFSESLKCHQKHPRGFETINTYLEREHLFPQDLQDYIYMSQLLQAQGIGMAIEAHRSSKPRNMGTLYWQLNDCWPVTSWSGMDFYGNWKALQYTVRELYKDIMVSIIDDGENTTVHLVSDRLTETQGELSLFLTGFSGEKIELMNDKISLEANTSLNVFKISLEELRNKINFHEFMIEAVFKTGNSDIYRNQKFLLPVGKINFPEANLAWRTEPTEGGHHIIIESDAFAAHVHLYLEKNHAWFDQNFFHMKKGEEIKVFCRTSLDGTEFIKQLKISHLKEYLTKSES
jgi:beta-mannosidase